MIEHPYAPFLSELNRPGRYIGGEYGAKEVPCDPDLRLVLAYPDSYEIGMSHIGTSVLYEVVNSLPDISAERVFMPWSDLELALKKHAVPLVSLESARPLSTFDIIGFSLQFELNYTNLLAMLSMGHVPRRASKRGEDDPIVLVGGPIAYHLEPLAPFIDLALIGDGEEALPELLFNILEAKKKGHSRKDLLKKMHNLRSVFAPNYLTRSPDPISNKVVVEKGTTPVVERAIISSLKEHPPGLGPVPHVESVFDRYSIEIARGCTQGCRFCQASFLYRPVRERSEDETLDAVERAVTCLGFDEVSLASLSTADHSRVGPLISTLGEVFTPRRISLSVPSLRAYGLPDSLVEVLSRLRATGVTLAPEAGSQRMRDVINKNISEDDLITAATRFFDWGFTRIKLYFMIGLPSETDEDVLEIVKLSERLRNVGRQRLLGRNPSVTVSVSTFVPRPFTPFEREKMIGPEEIRRRQSIITGRARRGRIDVKLHDPRLSLLEGLLCRGDSRFAWLLERAVDLGARFDGWDEMFNEKIWDEVLKDVDIPSELDAIPDDARLPWDHVLTGVDPQFLKAQRDLSRAAATTGRCGRFVSQSNQKVEFICNGCGLACPPSSLPVNVLREKPENEPPPPKRPQRGKPRPRGIDADALENAVRIRLFWARWGRQAFLGHLDTMRHIMRSLRRAGLDLVYTQGFHPKPKIQSAPPLPLGTIGLNEPLDLYLSNPPKEDEILRALADVVPPDFAFNAVKKVPTEEKSLSKRIKGAEYVALVLSTPDEARASLARLLQAESLVVERSRKGKTKQIDIRPFLIDAKVLDRPDSDLHLPFSKERVPVLFTLALPGSGGARATEILNQAFGIGAKDAWIVRTQIILE